LRGYHGIMNSQEPETKTPKPRGFAAMSPEKQKELSRRGGEAAHRKGVAHRFTAADAREAGRKGGRATHAKRRAERAESSES
jgi:general stress protein YciG